MGWNRTEGRGYKDFKKGGGKLGQGVGTLKRGAAGTPLRTMTLFDIPFKSHDVTL